MTADGSMALNLSAAQVQEVGSETHTHSSNSAVRFPWKASEAVLTAAARSAVAGPA